MLVTPVISKLADVAGVSGELEASSVCVPAVSMARSEKVATPLTAETGEVPNSEPGPLPCVIDTEAVEMVTSWPTASSTRTVTPAGSSAELMG